jgi:hypothetical protein
MKRPMENAAPRDMFVVSQVGEISVPNIYRVQDGILHDPGKTSKLDTIPLALVIDQSDMLVFGTLAYE